MALGMVLLQGPRGRRFLMSEVPLLLSDLVVQVCVGGVRAMEGGTLVLRP